jgi:hypothetical protein
VSDLHVGFASVVQLRGGKPLVGSAHRLRDCSRQIIQSGGQLTAAQHGSLRSRKESEDFWIRVPSVARSGHPALPGVGVMSAGRAARLLMRASCYSARLSSSGSADEDARICRNRGVSVRVHGVPRKHRWTDCSARISLYRRGSRRSVSFLPFVFSPRSLRAAPRPPADSRRCGSTRRPPLRAARGRRSSTARGDR